MSLAKWQGQQNELGSGGHVLVSFAESERRSKVSHHFLNATEELDSAYERAALSNDGERALNEILHPIRVHTLERVPGFIRPFFGDKSELGYRVFV